MTHFLRVSLAVDVVMNAPCAEHPCRACEESPARVFALQQDTVGDNLGATRTLIRVKAQCFRLEGVAASPSIDELAT